MSRKRTLSEGRAQPGQRPQTREQWREAVDSAHVLLLLDSARQYGLITGGPEADVVRCQAVLEEGARIGVKPAWDAVERLLADGLV